MTTTTTQTVTLANGSIVFNNTYTGAVSGAYQSCILSAEQQIANTWHNAVTINVEFDAQSPGQTGWLAENNFFIANVSYASLKSALTSLSSAEPGNTYLQQAVAHLPSADPSGGAGFALPLPYARMLGLSTSSRNPEDTVTLNTSYNWSYGQDVVNTIEHEISEGGMGRIGGLGDDNNFWSTMDLFRYNSSGQADYSDGRDGRTTFFSYNGGGTLSTLSFNNEFNSSGVQVNLGDTADFTQLDVFGTGSPGETNTLSPTDMAIMDSLGWNPAINPGKVSAVGDFNRDSHSDLAYFSSDTWTTTLQFLNGTTTLGGGPITNSGLQGPSGTGWTPVESADFNNDGYSDLVYYNSSLGDTEIQLLNGTTGTGGGMLSNSSFEHLPGWIVAGVGDFNKDGHSDLLYYNASLGDTQIQFVNGTTGTGGGMISNSSFENLPGWTVAGVGDFNGDGYSDLVYYNAALGDTQIQFLKGNMGAGGGMISNSSFENLPGWTVAGVGDFNGDGKDDLVYFNASSGVTEIQFLNGNTGIGGGLIQGSPFENNPSWSIVGVGDFNHDGIDDLVYYNSSTDVYELQTLNGVVATSTQQIGSASGLASSAAQTELTDPSQPQDIFQVTDLFPAPADSLEDSNINIAAGFVGSPMKLPPSENSVGSPMELPFSENTSAPPPGQWLRESYFAAASTQSGWLMQPAGAASMAAPTEPIADPGTNLSITLAGTALHPS